MSLVPTCRADLRCVAARAVVAISRRTGRPKAARRANAPRNQSGRLWSADPQTGVAPGMTRSRNVRSRCRCSMCPAIHINSRSWLRSSSTHEPSDPPHRVVNIVCASSPSPSQQQLGFAAQYRYLPRERGQHHGTCVQSVGRVQPPLGGHWPALDRGLRYRDV